MDGDWTEEPADTQPVNSQDLHMQCADHCPPIDYYGVLIPLYDKNVASIYLDSSKSEFKMGRCENNNHQVDYDFSCLKEIRRKIYLGISKHHLTINRECNMTFILDQSGNGTFINEELIGKGKSRVLNHNDIISMPHQGFKVFKYMETLKNDSNESYPKELAIKYVVSRIQLGQGAMGRVMLAHDKDNSDRRLAVKIIRKIQMSVNKTNTVGEQIRREIEIMKTVKHPCCIEVEDVFDGSINAYIAMELVEGGELFDRIVEPKRQGRGLGEKLTKLYAYQMLSAVQYLHRKNITHRDLKPENILLVGLDDLTLLKVSDFGLSKLVDEHTALRTFCGTRNYLAPEVLRSNGMGKYTEAIDLWSLGVIFFTSMVGYPPFSSDYQDMTLNDQILRGRLKFNIGNAWTEVSSTARDLVQKLITVSTKKRLSADQALLHPWFQDSTMLQSAHLLFETHKYHTNLLVETKKLNLNGEIIEEEPMDMADSTLSKTC